MAERQRLIEHECCRACTLCQHMQALGIDVDTGTSAEANASTATGQQLLDQLMTPVLRTLYYEDSHICLSCIPFLTAHLARVRNACKRQVSAEVGLRPQLLQLMEVTPLAPTPGL